MTLTGGVRPTIGDIQSIFASHPCSIPRMSSSDIDCREVAGIAALISDSIRSLAVTGALFARTSPISAWHSYAAAGLGYNMRDRLLRRHEHIVHGGRRLFLVRQFSFRLPVSATAIVRLADSVTFTRSATSTSVIMTPILERKLLRLISSLNATYRRQQLIPITNPERLIVTLVQGHICCKGLVSLNSSTTFTHARSRYLLRRNDLRSEGPTA